ncbi:MAG: hypothetical protein HWN81_05700 [Candidatus Lokiarchaeota archaeon]|nr:hypothetical protein [Candidatus Lokiarchaeota archaeon]
MGKEKDKDKDKKDKDKDKEKKEKKEKEEKEKDKDKKDKDKKDKDKKDKDKEKEKKDKDKIYVEQEWKLSISKNLDALTHAYEKITNKFRDIDNYVLKDAKSEEEFIEKVKKYVEDLPDASKQIFLAFLESI